MARPPRPALTPDDIRALWAHPLCELDVAERFGIDNDHVAAYCERVAATRLVPDSRWDCEVVSSFRDDAVNRTLAQDLVELRDALKTCANEFAALVGWGVRDEDEYVPALMWFNLYRGRHWQEKHNHVSHNIAAVYFVTSDTTPTTFFNPNLETVQGRYPQLSPTDFNRRTVKVTPRAGTLVLFPGYLHHAVQYRDLPERPEQRRITIAANFDVRRRDQPPPRRRHLIDR